MRTSQSPTVRSQLPDVSASRDPESWGPQVNKFKQVSNLSQPGATSMGGKARGLYKEGWDKGLYKGKKALYSEVQWIMVNGQIGPHLWTHGDAH